VIFIYRDFSRLDLLDPTERSSLGLLRLGLDYYSRNEIYDILEYRSSVAVVITNQVISSPDVFFGNPQRPAGGNIIAHASTYRFWIRKGREGKRIVKVLDSPYHPESEAIFTITENGIIDP